MTTMSARVSVIILNWNGKPHLESCLSSVMAQTCPDFEVVLVDNGSTDGSAEFVARRFPQVRIIRHDENLGFAAGNNTAIRATRSPYVATLNNDAQAKPAWLVELVEAMESDDQVGMCASKMLFAHRPEVIDSAGLSPDVDWLRCVLCPPCGRSGAPSSARGSSLLLIWPGI